MSRWRWLRRIPNPEGLVEEEEIPAQVFHLHVLLTRGKTVDRRYAHRIEAGVLFPRVHNFQILIVLQDPHGIPVETI